MPDQYIIEVTENRFEIQPSGSDTTEVTVVSGSVSVVAETAAVSVVTADGLQGPPGPPGLSPESLSSPVFTWNAGVLERVDYAGGEYKTFAYASGRLSSVTTVINGVPYVKTFNWDLSGVLLSITET